MSAMRKLLTLSRVDVRRMATTALPPELVVFPNTDMIVCWHPEQDFPYECSKALPPVAKTLSREIIDVSRADATRTFAKDLDGKLLALKLGKMTYTTMHPWFPRSRDKKAKKTLPDRPYL